MGLCLKSFLVISLVVAEAMLLMGLVFLALVLPQSVEQKIGEALVIRNGSETAERFVKSPVPAYMTFYFFNVTNKEEVNDNGAKPQLQEVGPYVYRQEKRKNVTKWDERFGTVHYKEYAEYFFEPEKTKGNLADVINHVNAVPFGVAYKMKDYDLASDEWYSTTSGELVETHTVDELLFGGYSIQDALPLALQVSCEVLLPCVTGFYYGKNATYSKEFVVSTGTRSINDYTDIKLFDNEPILSFWFGDSCNAINGTDGRQFHPGISKNEQLHVFSADICRSLMLKYEQDVTIEDIPALRFVVPETVFADPNVQKENMCFCQEDASKECKSKAGVLPLWPCQPGKPVLVSSPHFYQGDSYYSQKFGGLSPNKVDHQTFLDIEPMTGTVVSAAKRIQISVLVMPVSRLNAAKFINEITYFPAFWAEEVGRIDAANAVKFRQKLLIPYYTVKWSLVAMVSVGGVLLLILLVITFKKMSRSRGALKINISEDEQKGFIPINVLPSSRYRIKDN